MTIEQIRVAFDAKPFKPFVLHRADGDRISVSSREFIYPPPVGRTIVVCLPDGTLNIVDLLLVSHLEFKPARNGRKKTPPA